MLKEIKLRAYDIFIISSLSGVPLNIFLRLLAFAIIDFL